MRINYLNHLASRPQSKLNGSHQCSPNLQNCFDSPISNFTTPWMWSVVVKLHKRICPSAKRNIEPLSTNCNNSPLKSIQPLWNYYRRTRADPRFWHDGGGGHFCGNNLGSLKLVTKAVYSDYKIKLRESRKVKTFQKGGGDLSPMSAPLLLDLFLIDRDNIEWLAWWNCQHFIAKRTWWHFGIQGHFFHTVFQIRCGENQLPTYWVFGSKERNIDTEIRCT